MELPQIFSGLFSVERFPVGINCRRCVPVRIPFAAVGCVKGVVVEPHISWNAAALTEVNVGVAKIFTEFFRDISHKLSVDRQHKGTRSGIGPELLNRTVSERGVPLFCNLEHLFHMSRTADFVRKIAEAELDFCVRRKSPAGIIPCKTDVIVSHDPEFSAGPFLLDPLCKILVEPGINICHAGVCAALHVIDCHQVEFPDDGIIENFSIGHKRIAHPERDICQVCAGITAFIDFSVGIVVSLQRIDQKIGKSEIDNIEIVSDMPFRVVPEVTAGGGVENRLQFAGERFCHSFRTGIVSAGTGQIAAQTELFIESLIFVRKRTEPLFPEFPGASGRKTGDDRINSAPCLEVGGICIRDRRNGEIFDCRSQGAVFPGEVETDTEKTFHKVIRTIPCSGTGSQLFQRLHVVTVDQRRVMSGNDDTPGECFYSEPLIGELEHINAVFSCDGAISNNDHIFSCGDIFDIHHLNFFTGAFFDRFRENPDCRSNTFRTFAP